MRGSPHGLRRGGTRSELRFPLPEMTSEGFNDWLRRYGDAWERRDPAAAAALFTDDAVYWWTPFGEPKRGPGEIAKAWGEATTRQRDVRFEFEIIAVTERAGIATWHTKLVRASTGREIEVDGVLLAELDEAGRCRLFREWWHSTEHEHS